MGTLSSQLLGAGEVKQAGPGKALPLAALFIQPGLTSDLREDSVPQLLVDFAPDYIPMDFRGSGDAQGRRVSVCCPEACCPCFINADSVRKSSPWEGSVPAPGEHSFKDILHVNRTPFPPQDEEGGYTCLVVLNLPNVETLKYSSLCSGDLQP